MITKTKIEWADFSWNPVWGCWNQCPYCYARRLAKRFGESFEPHWKEKNYQRAFPKKPSRIFVNSMSEVAYWKDSWWKKVFARIEENPLHKFLFLTKNPRAYEIGGFSENCWLGLTITRQREMNAFADYLFDCTWTDTHVMFLSIEPILTTIQLYVYTDWVIVGAETGNRKEKVVPKREWIEKIVKDAEAPVFMKDSLIPIWGENLIREFPG